MLAQHKEEAVRELGRFFRLDQGRMLPMPIGAVDEVWHELVERPDSYASFCHGQVGHHVEHSSECVGEGAISWKEEYEKAHGEIPEIWFRDANGNLDEESRDRYLKTGIWKACWECGPIQPSKPEESNELVAEVIAN